MVSLWSILWRFHTDHIFLQKPLREYLIYSKKKGKDVDRNAVIKCFRMRSKSYKQPDIALSVFLNVLACRLTKAFKPPVFVTWVTKWYSFILFYWSVPHVLVDMALLIERSSHSFHIDFLQSRHYTSVLSLVTWLCFSAFFLTLYTQDLSNNSQNTRFSIHSFARIFFFFYVSIFHSMGFHKSLCFFFWLLWFCDR